MQKNNENGKNKMTNGWTIVMKEPLYREKMEPSKREKDIMEPSKREKMDPSKREKMEPSKREKNSHVEPSKREKHDTDTPKGGYGIEGRTRTPTKWENGNNETTKWSKYIKMKDRNGGIMTRESKTHEKTEKNRNKRRRARKAQDRKERKMKNQEEMNNGITVMYVNVNGIGDKALSLQTAAKMVEADIIAITETKQIPPKIDGYAKWMSKERKDRQGGGVAITVREELDQVATRCTEFDDDPQEIIWMELKVSKTSNVYICTYYGKQEKAPTEEVETEYSNITAQVEYFKKRGEVILTGDFNAKLYIERQRVLQQQSPHGHILQNMIDFNQLHVATLNAQKGLWTRQNRNNQDEKSVIDYILVTENIKNQIHETIVDEEGHIRIKGRKETDHNTIVMNTGIQTCKTERKIKRYKMNNIAGWEKYREQITTNLERKKPQTPEELTGIIVHTMKETVGEVTVTVGRNRRGKENEEVKNAREEKKKMKKEYEKAIKEKEDMEIRKQAYIESQEDLRRKIEKNIKEESERNLEKMRRKFSIKTNEFWKHRAKCEGKGQRDEYDTITEDGKTLTNENEAKEYIAEFYENLYRGRESHPDYKESSDNIEEWCKVRERELEKEKEVEKIKKKECDMAIKKLKRNKAMGPDMIPNEALIEMDGKARQIMVHVFNKTNEAKGMPDTWQEGELNRLYKGKGKKGKCSNERGITLSSNLGKLYERIINERIKGEVNMTWAQAGGRKGSATTDHILLLKEILKTTEQEKETAYMVFLDVTKAFDKAWLSGIMHILHESGIQDKHWLIVKHMNENLKAIIRTKYGHTRKISITNSIRQGGVLSVILFGLLMDQISKETHEKHAGIQIQQTDLTISTLLWVDDVVIVEKDPQKMQLLLDNVDKIAKKYHLEFGESKSKVMKIGKSNEKPTFKLGDMNLEYVDQYKYLGYVQNSKNSNETHLKALKGKVEAAYQRTLALATNPTLKLVEMQTIWTTLETCIIPIITYAGEVMELKTKKEQTEVNRLLENIVKRILKVPRGTPTEALYVETGLLPPMLTIYKNRVNMHTRLEKGKNPWLKKIIEEERNTGWIKETRQIEERIGIDRKKERDKRSIRRQMEIKVSDQFKKKVEECRNEQGKSKLKHLLEGKEKWEPAKCPPYMQVLTRNQASIIFKARTRMVECKDNFKNKYKSDTTCRKCKKETETQKHILQECPVLHTTDSSKVSREEIFTEDPGKLRQTAKKIEAVLGNLAASEPGGINPRRPP